MKISIITVSYNSESTIAETIESVLSQSYQDFEYLIIDGLSHDGTVDIIKKYEPKFNGRLHWVSHKDKGIYDAMNKGIQMAKGDIIGIINSDDFYMNDKVLENVIDGFERKNVDSLYTDLYLVDPVETNKIIRNCRYREFKKGLFFKGWHPPHPAFFVKKSIYDKYGSFDLSYKIAADYEFMLRVLEKYAITTVYLPIHTIKMRNGGVSTTSIDQIKLSQEECLLAFKKNGLQINKLRYFIGKYIQKIRQYSFKSLVLDLMSKK